MPLRKILILLFSAFGCPLLSIGEETKEIERFRKAAFNPFDQPACIQLSRGLDQPKVDTLGMVRTFKSIAAGIVSNDAKTIAKLMHPRLQASESKVKRMIEELNGIYEGPLSTALYRVWALNTPRGDSSPLPCFEDELAIGPHYGYTLQFGAWIQITGQKDLARLYVSLVPTKEGWRIGAWHAQQWTYNGKDPDTLINDGLLEDKAKDRLSAYVLLDLAAKLLDGGGYVFLAKRENVLLTRDKIYNQKELLAFFSKLSVSLKLVSMGTIFATEAPGLLLRFEVPKDTKVNDLHPACLKEITSIYNAINNKKFGGARCSFVVPGEDPNRDGHLGSRLVRKSEILGLVEKPAKNPKK